MHGVKRSLAPPSASAREARKKKEAAKLEQYLVVEKAFFEAKSMGSLDEGALDATTNLLAANPEHYTAWNYRRKILANLFVTAPPAQQKEVPDFFAAAREVPLDSKGGSSASSPSLLLKRRLLEEDLMLTQEALRIHPKVYWIWNHRKWCLIEMPTDEDAEEADTNEKDFEAKTKALSAKWQREMGLVNKMLDLDPRNFHGWDYRRYLLTQIALSSVTAFYTSSPASSSSSSTPPTLPSWPFTLTHHTTPSPIKTHHLTLARTELTYTLRKIEANFSNFSAWHQRSLLLPLVWGCEAESEAGKGKGKGKEVKLDEEFELVRQAMYTDPEDSSVWLYHAWLVDQLGGAAGDGDSVAAGRVGETLRREVASIEELLEVEPDSKWCLEALVRYKGLLVWLLDKAGKEEERQTLRQQRREMLGRLVEVDPDRRGRWQELLGDEEGRS